VLQTEVASKTIADGVEAFKLLKRMEGRMERTMRDYNRVLGDFLDVIGDIPLTDLSPAAVRAYVRGLVERGWKAATVNVYVRVVRCFLNFLYQEGLIRERLAAHVKPMRVPRQYPRVLTSGQARALIAAAKAKRKSWTGLRNYVMVCTFIECMLRLSELRNLEIGDVSLEARSIRVRHGKGDKERFVFMGRSLTRLMADWLRVRGEWIGEERVFISRGGYGLDERNVQRILQRLADRAGIGKVSPHMLRHTGATLLAKSGISVFALKELLGHADIQTTMIYVHMAGSALREAHVRNSSVDRLLGG
jgi:site-specific recombinase XerD